MAHCHMDKTGESICPTGLDKLFSNVVARLATSLLPFDKLVPEQMLKLLKRYGTAR